MGKKILIIMVLFLIFILQVEPKKEVQKEKKKEEKVEEQIEEKRAIYISYIELQKYIKGKTVSDAKKNIDRMIQNINDFHFNMILLQVRSFSDAIYESKYFPWCSCVTDDVNSSPGFDVLDYFIKKSHNKNIELHAWVNPYRISNKTDTSTLSKDSYAYQFLESGDAKVIEKGIFYNPASSKVQKLIVDGITEILENYKVDGIHFDDYFYPSRTKGAQLYNVSVAKRKKVINKMVKKVYKTVKNYDENLLFGISPAGNIEYAESIGCDLKTWLSKNGYMDYIVPQIYWTDQYVINGKITKLFTNRLNRWVALNKNDTPMYIGLGLCLGGSHSSTDLGWGRKNNNIVTQIKQSKHKGCKGFVLFSSTSLYSSSTKKEVKNYHNYIKSQ